MFQEEALKDNKRETVKKDYLIVEVERPRTPVAWSDEDRDMVMSLRSHPGFLALMRKLRAQRNYLESILKSERHADMRTVEFIQSGIAWTGWLEQQVSVLFKQQAPSATPATADEKKLFEQMNELLSDVGK